MSGEPGSLRNGKGNLSVWRVPNYLLEARGLFLGERLRLIDGMNKIRSGAGVFLVICMIVYYSGLNHLCTMTTGPDGTRTCELGNDTPGGGYFLSLMMAVFSAILTVPLVGLGLVLWTRRGARLATLRQMLWPVAAFAAVVGVFLAALGVIAAGNGILKLVANQPLVTLAVRLVLIAAGVVVLAWIFKSLYLAADGLFRAEDAHPLLPIIGTPIVAWSTYAAMLAIGGSSGLTAVPKIVGLWFGLGGPISITVVSVISYVYLRRACVERGIWPLRDGPVGRTSGAGSLVRASLEIG